MGEILLKERALWESMKMVLDMSGTSVVSEVIENKWCEEEQIVFLRGFWLMSKFIV